MPSHDAQAGLARPTEWSLERMRRSGTTGGRGLRIEPMEALRAER